MHNKDDTVVERNRISAPRAAEQSSAVTHDASSDLAALLRQAVEDAALASNTDRPLRTDVGQRLRERGVTVGLTKARSMCPGLVVVGGIAPNEWIALAEQTPFESGEPQETKRPFRTDDSTPSSSATRVVQRDKSHNVPLKPTPSKIRKLLLQAVAEVGKEKKTPFPLRFDVGLRFKQLCPSSSLVKALASIGANVVRCGGEGQKSWLALPVKETQKAHSPHATKSQVVMTSSAVCSLVDLTALFQSIAVVARSWKRPYIGDVKNEFKYLTQQQSKFKHTLRAAIAAGLVFVGRGSDVTWVDVTQKPLCNANQSDPQIKRVDATNATACRDTKNVLHKRLLEAIAFVSEKKKTTRPRRLDVGLKFKELCPSSTLVKVLKTAEHLVEVGGKGQNAWIAISKRVEPVQRHDSIECNLTQQLDAPSKDDGIVDAACLFQSIALALQSWKWSYKDVVENHFKRLRPGGSFEHTLSAALAAGVVVIAGSGDTAHVDAVSLRLPGDAAAERELLPTDAAAHQSSIASLLRQAIEKVARNKRTDRPPRTDVGQELRKLGAGVRLAEACLMCADMVLVGGNAPDEWIALRSAKTPVSKIIAPTQVVQTPSDAKCRENDTCVASSSAARILNSVPVLASQSELSKTAAGTSCNSVFAQQPSDSLPTCTDSLQPTPTVNPQVARKSPFSGAVIPIARSVFPELLLKAAHDEVVTFCRQQGADPDADAVAKVVKERYMSVLSNKEQETLCDQVVESLRSAPRKSNDAVVLSPSSQLSELVKSSSLGAAMPTSAASIEKRPELINDLLRSQAVVRDIVSGFDAAPSSYAVAVDLEGERIGPPEGRLAIVTVCTPDQRVLLFDVAAMGAEAFDGGMLRDLLEHPQLPKLWFDCRADTAELHKYNVKPRCVVDLQVGAMRSVGPQSPFLIGLAKTLDTLKLVTAADARIKESGKRLFAPERGGSYTVFFDRPMNLLVAQYCAVDVTHLFEMRSQLSQFEGESSRVAVERIDRYASAGFVCGKHMAEKDF